MLLFFFWGGGWVLITDESVTEIWTLKNQSFSFFSIFFSSFENLFRWSSSCYRNNSRSLIFLVTATFTTPQCPRHGWLGHAPSSSQSQPHLPHHNVPVMVDWVTLPHLLSHSHIYHTIMSLSWLIGSRSLIFSVTATFTTPQCHCHGWLGVRKQFPSFPVSKTGIIIMHIYHALINAPSAHMIHINLNMIFYTHVEHSPTKTVYIKNYKRFFIIKKQLHTHTHTQCVNALCSWRYCMVS